MKFKFEFLFISHWKFSAFKYGSLGYLSRKGCHRNKDKCKTFPKDNHTDSDHLTPFLVYKAGCTQFVREFNSMTNKINNFIDVTDQVTILETLPLIIVIVVGYIETPRGLQIFKTVWAKKASEEIIKDEKSYLQNIDWYPGKDVTAKTNIKEIKK